MDSILDQLYDTPSLSNTIEEPTPDTPTAASAPQETVIAPKGPQPINPSPKADVVEPQPLGTEVIEPTSTAPVSRPKANPQGLPESVTAQIDNSPQATIAKLYQDGHSDLAASLANRLQSESQDPGVFSRLIASVSQAQSWDEIKNSQTAITQEALKLARDGKIEEAKMLVNYKQEGLIQTTGPLEWIGGGYAGIVKSTGTWGASTALKSFALAAPVDFATTVYTDEISEEHPFVGMTASVVTGMMSGLAGDRLVKVFTKEPKLATMIESVGSMDPLKVNANIAKGVSTKAFSDPEIAAANAFTDPRLGKYGRFKDIYDVYNQFKSVESPGYISGTSAIDAAPITNLAAKTAAYNQTKFEYNFMTGDLRDLEVRKALQTIVDEVKTVPNPTPEQATLTQALATKIKLVSQPRAVSVPAEQLPIAPAPAPAPASAPVPAEQLPTAPAPASAPAPAPAPAPATMLPRPEPIKTEKLDSPFFSNASISAKESQLIRAKVLEDWYGVPDKSANELINEEADALKLANPKLSKADVLKQALDIYNAKNAQGFYGEDFRSDVENQFKLLQSRAEKAKQKTNELDLWKQAEAEVANNYKIQVDQAILEAHKSYVPGSFAGKTKQYVRGGAEGSYDWEAQQGFSTPPGEYLITNRVPKGKNKTAPVMTSGSDVSFKDWSIDDHIVHVPESNSLEFQMTPISAPVAGTKTKPDFASRNIDYSRIKSLADADFALKGFIKRWETAKALTSDKKYQFKEGEALKRPSWYYDAEKGKTVDFEDYPDDVPERVAKLFGWHESKVQPVAFPTRSAGLTSPSGRENPKAYNYSAEDIIKNRAAYHEWDKTNPGYIRKQADKPSSARDDRYVQLTSGRSAYNKQREQFLRNSFGLAPDAPKWKIKDRMARLYVMEQKLLNDINLANGSPQENWAKRVYLRWKDLVTGSNNIGNIRTIDRAKIRQQGYAEVVDMQMKRAGAKTEFKNSPVIDDLQTAEDAIEGAPTLEGRLSDMAGTDMRVSQVEDFLHNISARETFLLAQQAEHVEDLMQVRVAGAGYRPLMSGGDGKFNVFKINSINDLSETLSGIPDAPVFDYQHVLGITPVAGRTDAYNNVLANAIYDSQEQMVSLARSITESPSNVTSAIAFEKLRHINNVLVSEFTTGGLNSSAKMLSEYNFHAINDKQLIKRLSEIVDSHYIVYADTGADTRITTMIADMLQTLKTPEQRMAFLRGIADMDTKVPIESIRTVKNTRAFLTKVLGDACAH